MRRHNIHEYATVWSGILLTIGSFLLVGCSTPERGLQPPLGAARTVSPAVDLRASPAPVAASRQTPSVAIVAPRAKEHISYALDLAERGATYSAREEFIRALELVAEALDADTTTKTHAHAVVAGLRALKEADDFAPRPLRYQTDLNLAQLAAVHRTGILKDADTSRLTPVAALQLYYAYATQQLALAGRGDPTASMALYGLGRVASVTNDEADIRSPMSGPKAVAFYQAALWVDPRNHMAANELGVLLARYGRMQEAKTELLHSLSIAPQPETWHNLSTVCHQLDQHEEAERAREQHASLTNLNRARGARAATSHLERGRPLIRYVAPETFARTGAPYGLDGPAVHTARSGGPEPTTEPERVQPKPMNADWLPRWTAWRRREKSPRTNSTIHVTRRNGAPRGS